MIFKLKVLALVSLMVLVTVVDFASRVLSVASDGILVVLALLVVRSLVKDK